MLRLSRVEFLRRMVKWQSLRFIFFLRCAPSSGKEAKRREDSEGIGEMLGFRLGDSIGLPIRFPSTRDTTDPSTRLLPRATIFLSLSPMRPQSPRFQIRRSRVVEKGKVKERKENRTKR